MEEGLSEATVRSRPYDPQRDQTSGQRVWREVGWLLEGKEKVVDRFLMESRTRVAEVDGAAECLVSTLPGWLRYQEEDLPLLHVAAVTSGHVVRRRGIAAQLLASVLAEEAAEGAILAALGMFEQGYYNRLGFGTGSYERWVAFDPARLAVRVRPRTPTRLTTGDWLQAYEAFARRQKGHGAYTPASPTIVRCEMEWLGPEFGFGYHDGPNGELSHYLWFGADAMEYGPYRVLWMAYQNREQLLELLAFMRSLGDQVRLITMREPPGIQMQDLLLQPLRERQVRRGSRFEVGIRAAACWQARIIDLGACMDRTHLPEPHLRFNLRLTDPVRAYLPDGGPWSGTEGVYVVDLGPQSSAAKGSDPSLPMLEASVGAFTRMWLGVQPATGLAVTDRLSGEHGLLHALDQKLRLPEPFVGWEI